MGVELPIFSFLSTFLLTLILPAPIHYYNIPSASIIAWLFFCNIIHGINSILWFENQAVHAPAWCDISSVLLLGAMVAIPCSFLCIARRLEAITSSRDLEQRQRRTYETALETATCFLVPALYMGLHTFVQDRRFVILENFGCQAAVGNYYPALVIVWSPPLCISIIGICFCLSAAINVGKSHYNSRSYFPSAPEMTSALFTRRIIFVLSGMLYVAFVHVYTLSSITSSGLLPWTSISQTRSQISQVEVIPSYSQLSIQSKLIWCFIPFWSLLFILSVIGEETQRGYRTTFTWLSRKFKRDMLPVHMRSSPKTATVPVHSLRSGWDQDLDLHSPLGSFSSKCFSPFKKAESTRTSTPSPTFEDEAMFTQYTHDYLASARAQQLRLPLPPAVRVQNHAPLAILPKQLPARTSATPTAAMNGDPILSGSPDSTFFPAHMWPQPPPTERSSVSPLASVAIADPPRPSSPLSTRSSLGSTIIDALGAIPTHLRDAPFSVNRPGVTAVPVVQGPSGPMQHHPSTRRKPKKPEVVYMTVVHETTAGT